MTSLARLQAEFQAHVLGEPSAIAEAVVDTPRAPAATRLGIYAHAYRRRLVEVLEGDYDTVHAMIGDGQFEALCLDYIRAHPSDHPNLRWFGRHLPEFLGATEPYRQAPVVAEMAGFERALQTAFDARDMPALAMDTVAAIPPQDWAGMRPGLRPGVTRLDLAWNVVEIWKALDGGADPPQPQVSEFPAPWLVWRAELTPRFRSLTVDEAWALDAILAGETFGAVCEGLCEWMDAQFAGPRAAELLRGWVAEGLIGRMDTGLSRRDERPGSDPDA